MVIVLAVLVGVAVGVIAYLVAERLTRSAEPTGERCEVCGVALTTATQVEVRDDPTDDAETEIAQMGGGSFLAAYSCRKHAPTVVA